MQERRVLGMVAQQLVAETVDQEHHVAARLGKRQRRLVEPGVDSHRPGDGREHVAERPVLVGRSGELLVHVAGPPMVRADSDSANASRLATASLPSAAALTRIEKSSEATTPV